MTSGSHSSYHALQTSISQSTARMGLSFQASYTFSKSLDDASAVPGGISGSPGAILQTLPRILLIRTPTKALPRSMLRTFSPSA